METPLISDSQQDGKGYSQITQSVRAPTVRVGESPTDAHVMNPTCRDRVG